jgi:hypothetical protein
MTVHINATPLDGALPGASQREAHIELPAPALWRPASSARRVERVARLCRSRMRTGRRREETRLVAPGYVQSAVAEASGQPSPQSVSISGTSAGNWLCVVCGAQDSSVPSVAFDLPTAPGLAFQEATSASMTGGVGGGTNPFVAVSTFFAPNITAGSHDISCSWAGGDPGAQGFYAFELSGVDTYDNGATELTIDGVSDPSIGPFTTRYPDVIIVVSFTGDGSATAGPGYTLIENTPGVGAVLMYGVLPAGSQTATINYSFPQPAGNIAAAFGKKTAPDAMFFGMT